jgi:site-specific DNA recombinase
MSRSLLDFAKLIDVFDDYKISFVSITQSFSTASSMGRLMLNVLLSFAQYERELTGERIRDKFALSRQKGMWMGGSPPLGYDAADRKLVINPQESKLVQLIFERFAELKSTTKLVRELYIEGHTTKSWVSRRGKHHQGQAFSKNALRCILLNPLYRGCVVHKGKVYPGEHQAIINEALWEKVQGLFTTFPYNRGRESTSKPSALLKGLIRCQPCGSAMVPTYTKQGHKRYHYYVCGNKRKGLKTACTPISAFEVESFVTQQVRRVLRCPEVIASVCHAVTQNHGLPESKAIGHLQRLEEVWEELFPGEQQRIIHMLVETVLMTDKGIDVRIRAEGLKSLVDEIKDDVKGEIEDRQAITEVIGEAA